MISLTRCMVISARKKVKKNKKKNEKKTMEKKIKKKREKKTRKRRNKKREKKKRRVVIPLSLPRHPGKARNSGHLISRGLGPLAARTLCPQGDTSTSGDTSTVTFLSPFTRTVSEAS